MSVSRFPCPCCGHQVFDEPPGSYDICLVCFWEDDVTQLRWPSLADGANAISLREAQQNVARYGACEERFAGDVRPPTAEEPAEPEFRPIHPNDSFEDAPVDPSSADDFPADTTLLYYWRPTFWRRVEN